jgi:hypothetical protein
VIDAVVADWQATEMYEGYVDEEAQEIYGDYFWAPAEDNASKWVKKSASTQTQVQKAAEIKRNLADDDTGIVVYQFALLENVGDAYDNAKKLKLRKEGWVHRFSGDT